MVRTLSLVGVLALASCNESGLLTVPPVEEVRLTVETPSYGDFAGDTIRVTGRVEPAIARLVVDGVPHPVSEDGTFDFRLGFDDPVLHPYRVIDLEASYDRPGEEPLVDTDRIPVFWGADPLETWPGAITMRLTDAGLASLSGVLDGALEALITPDLVLDTLPPVGGDGFGVTFEGFDRGDLEAALVPSEGSLGLGFYVEGVTLYLRIEADVFGFPVEVPGSVTFPEVTAFVPLGLDLAEDGTPLIVPGEIDLDVADPVLSLGDGGALDGLADLLLGALDLQALLDGALDGLAGQGGEIPLGGPIDLSFDLGGTPLSLALQELSADAGGVGLGLGVGIGEAAPAPPLAIGVPRPGPQPRPDLVASAHDGVLQALMSSDLLSALDQDIVIPGVAAGLFQLVLGNLPGGDTLPQGVAGWCVGIQPGEARVARFVDGRNPIFGIWLPDATLRFAYQEVPDGECLTWLDANVVLEVGLGFEDGALDLSVEVPEGRLREYGGVTDDPDAVVEQLGGLVSSLLDLAGGLLGGLGGGDGGGGFDLGDLLGGLDLGGLSLDGLAPRLTAIQPMLGADGQPVEGLHRLDVSLFDDTEEPPLGSDIDGY